MKLSFICPGAPKSATTTLYEILGQHPDIILPAVAESSFFAFEEMYPRGVQWFEREYFPDRNDGGLVGDFSTSYMTFAELACPRLMSTYGTDLSIIFMLRDPVDRAYSHYCMRRYNNLAEEQEFREIVHRLCKRPNELAETRLKELSRGYSSLSASLLDDWRYLHYFRNGEYNRIVRIFLEYFSIENMKFVFFEEFVANPRPYVNSILEFLNLESCDSVSCDIQSNTSGRIKFPLFHRSVKKFAANSVFQKIAMATFGYSNSVKLYYFLKNTNRTANVAPKLDDATRATLVHYYQSEIDGLERMLSRDLSFWRPNS